MNILCKFICKADVTLRPLAHAQLQIGTTVSCSILLVLAIPLNLSKSGMKVNGTKAIYFTLLYTKTTSTDQHPLSNLVGFLAVSRVNKAVVAIVPSLQKYPQFCQVYESDGAVRYYLKNLIPYMQQTPFI